MKKTQNSACHDPDFNNCGCAGGFHGFIDGRFEGVPGFVGFDNLDYRGFDNLNYKGFDNLDFRNVGTIQSAVNPTIGAASGVGKPGGGGPPASKTNTTVLFVVVAGIIGLGALGYWASKHAGS